MCQVSKNQSVGTLKPLGLNGLRGSPFVISDNGHGYDELPSVVVEFHLDGRILSVFAVALDEYVPVPCRRSHPIERLGVHGGDAWRPVRHGASRIGFAGMPIPTPAYARSWSCRYVAYTDDVPAVEFADCGA